MDFSGGETRALDGRRERTALKKFVAASERDKGREPCDLVLENEYSKTASVMGIRPLLAASCSFGIGGVRG